MSPRADGARIFISYAREDGEGAARDLRRRLVQDHDLSVWQDRPEMRGGEAWWRQIDEALERVEFLVLVMTPAAMRSATVRREWRLARRKGVSVIPVMAKPDLQFDALPGWMRDQHFVAPEIPEQWTRLVRTLEGPGRIPRVPFMARDLPAPFVPRPDVHGRMTEALLAEGPDGTSAPRAALVGVPGFGKTSLATAACHDERVQDRYYDGILWVTLGERPPDLVAPLKDLIEQLTGAQPGFSGVDAAAARFAEVVSDRKLLLVVDDVWNAAHMRPFLRSPSLAALVTTRDFGTLDAGVRVVDVAEMRRDEAAGLLTFDLEQGEPEAVTALATRLRRWPLLLCLANGVLRERVTRLGETLGRALAYAGKALEKRGLVAFDERNPAERSQAVAWTLDVSLENLGAEQRARFAELAVMPEDVDVPLAVAHRLWDATAGLDDFDTEELCGVLARLSLLFFDARAHHVRLHDVLREYLQGAHAAALPGIHVAFLDSWGVAEWSELPPDEPYLWDHLAHHLHGAGRDADLVATVKDLRYVAAKTKARNAAAVDADLQAAVAVAHDDVALYMLARSVRQIGHLLDRGLSRSEVESTLYARLRHLDALGSFTEPLAARLARPYLTPRHALPDVAHPALVRTLVEPKAHDALVACALSADGGVLAASDYDGNLTVWDTAAGVRLLRLARADEGDANGSSCAISDDGRLAACALAGRVRVADTSSGQLLWERDVAAEVADCALSGDGSVLVLAEEEGLRVLSGTDGTIRVMMRLGAPLGEAKLTACAVDQAGRRVVAGSDDGRLRVWDDLDAEPRLLKGHKDEVNACAVSADGSRIVSVSEDGTLGFWDGATGQRLWSTAEGNDLGSCAIDGSGTRAIAASPYEALKVWDLGRRAERFILERYHPTPVYGVAMSRDGRFAASLTGNMARVWDVVGEAPHSVREGENTWSVAATSDGRTVLAAYYWRGVWLMDAERGVELKALPEQAEATTWCAISGDGSVALENGGASRVRAWAVANGAELPLRGAIAKRALKGCALDESGTLLYLVGDQGELLEVELRTGKRRRAIRMPGVVGRVAVSGNGSVAAAVLDESKVVVARLLEAAAPRAAPVGDRPLASCALSHDGSLLAAFSQDGVLHAVRTDTMEVLWTQHGPDRWMTHVSVASDGSLVATSAYDGALRIWDARTGAYVTALYTDGALFCVEWLAGDRHLVASGLRGVYFLTLVP